MNIYEKLLAIQTELKAPKSKYNSFGNYKYRNCEDILEAAKPLLAKYKAVLMLSDSAEVVDGWHYIKATASLIDAEGGPETAVPQVSAEAREPLDKKGMDTAQVTGTASSYARKYALNGLFLIDDAKDADTDEYKGMEPATEMQINTLIRVLKEHDVTPKELKSLKGKKGFDSLTLADFRAAMKELGEE